MSRGVMNDRLRFQQELERRRNFFRENLRVLRTELLSQDITSKLNGSALHWADTTASLTGGPFLWSNEYGSSSAPTPKFRLHFVNNIAPGSTFQDLGVAESLEKTYHFTHQCPRQRFLCSAIARHSSWVGFLSHGSDTMTVDHARFYDSFIASFSASLRILNTGAIPNNFAQLIDVERNLSRMSFQAWPRLFEVAFAINTAMISEIDRRIPNFSRFEGIPCMQIESSIRRWMMDIGFLGNWVMEYIPDYWIHLEPQISALGSDDPRRTTYVNLQSQVAERFLHALIAVNNTISKLRGNLDEAPAHPMLHDLNGFVEFWQSEVMELLQGDWSRLESFLTTFDESFQDKRDALRDCIERRRLNRVREAFEPIVWRHRLEDSGTESDVDEGELDDDEAELANDEMRSDEVGLVDDEMGSDEDWYQNDAWEGCWIFSPDDDGTGFDEVTLADDEMGSDEDWHQNAAWVGCWIFSP